MSAVKGECFACMGETPDTHPANVYDDSGAAFAEFCPQCRESLEKRHEVLRDDVCVFCAESTQPRRCDGLEFIDEAGPDEGRHYHVCDDCRVSIIGGVKVRVVLL